MLSGRSRDADDPVLIRGERGEGEKHPPSDTRWLYSQHSAIMIGMELILIRHGESLGNALKGEEAVYTGRWDCDLTEKGLDQAKTLRRNPILMGADVFFCSSLKRAIQTARAFTDEELIIDERLQERSLGEFEGERIEDIKREPKYERYFHDPQYMKFRSDFVISAPGGESYGDVCERIRPFVKELERSAYEKAVIISHFCVIRCIAKEILSLSEEETLSFEVRNCEPIQIKATS